MGVRTLWHGPGQPEPAKAASAGGRQAAGERAAVAASALTSM